MCGSARSAVYYPIDVSASALAHCAQELQSAGRRRSAGDELSRRPARSGRPARSRTALLVLFLGSTIGNFEPDDGHRLCGFDPPGTRAGRRIAARHGPGEAHRAAAGCLRRPHRRNRGLQPEPSGPHQSRTAGRFRPTSVRPRHPLPRRGAAHRDAPAVAGLSDRQHPQGGPDRGFRRRAKPFARRPATSSTWNRSKPWRMPPASSWNSSGWTRSGASPKT